MCNKITVNKTKSLTELIQNTFIFATNHCKNIAINELDHYKKSEIFSKNKIIIHWKKKSITLLEQYETLNRKIIERGKTDAPTQMKSTNNLKPQHLISWWKTSKILELGKSKFWGKPIHHKYPLCKTGTVSEVFFSRYTSIDNKQS